MLEPPVIDTPVKEVSAGEPLADDPVFVPTDAEGVQKPSEPT